MSDQPSRPGAAAISPEMMRQLQAQQAVSAALRGGPRQYANGFAVAQTASDVSVVLLTNGNPTGVLSMSYISAKSLIGELQKVVKNFETAMKQEIKTIEEVEKELRPIMVKTNVQKL